MADRLLRSKHAVALVIALCFVLCAFMFCPNGTDVDGAGGSQDSSESQKTPCGDDAGYTFKDGVLTISGTGQIYGIDEWSYLGVQTVRFESGITEIGSYAFQNIKSIKNVEFPDTLSVIGSFAFDGCSKLNIGDVNCDRIKQHAFSGCIGISSLSVRCGQVEDNAFYGCSDLSNLSLYCQNVGGNAFGFCKALKNVNLSCNTVKENAFRDCGSLKYVDVESGSFDRNAFYGCDSLSSLSIGSSVNLNDDSLENLSNINHVTYSSKKLLDSSPFSVYGFASNVSDCTVSVSTSSVPANLFRNCASVDHVELSPSVSYVPPSAFQGCNLSSINFKNNSFSAFTESPFKTIGSDFTATYSGKSIPAHFMDGVTKLTSLTVNSNSDVERVGAFAFSNTYANLVLNMKSLSNKHAIVGESAFENNSGSVSITTPSTSGNYIDVGKNAFRGVSGTIDLSGVGYIMDVGESAFMGSNVTDFGSVVFSAIGDNAFNSCRSLVKITIPSQTASVGNFAFEECTNLGDLIFDAPEAVLGESAFSGLKPYTTFHIGSSITDVPDSMMAGSKATIAIDGKLKAVGAESFKGCSIKDGLATWSEVGSIGANAFKDCSFTTGDFSNMPHLYMVGKEAFSGSGVRKVVLPVTLNLIGEDAYLGCRDIVFIQIDKVPIEYMHGGISMFAGTGSSNGAKAVFGSSVTKIPENLFKGMYNLREVDLSSITTISSHAFAGTGLEEVTFPAGLTTVESMAFYECNSLSKIVFENAELKLGKNVFLSGTEHLDTSISCQRHSTASDYPWADDKRDKHMDYSHVAGEYSGMMEILFDVLEAVFGAEIANEIIDFFFDNVALNILESIDLGSTEENAALLVGIAIALLLLLFMFLFLDVSEGVRVMEILLAMATAAVFALNTARLLTEYMDWYSYLAIMVLAGLAVPVISGVYQIRSKRYPRDGETLLRLYSLDNNAINDIARGPWRFIRELPSKEPYYKYEKLTRIPRSIRLLLTVLMAPAGIVLSAIYSVSFLIFHLPAFVFSWILVKIFSSKDKKTHKHVSHCICPECGNMFPKPYYRCECGQIHKDLGSGKFGVHKAICGKCYSKIVCSYKGRRWEGSTEVCPECGEAIWIGEAEPFACTMIGATDSGKTSLITDAYRYAKTRSGFSVSFPSPGTAKLVNEGDESGVPMDGKAEAIHTCLMKKDGAGDSKGIYAYDVDGDYYGGSFPDPSAEPMEYTFVDGMVLVINPYHMGDFSEDKGVPPVGVDINAVFSSFMTKYMNATNIGYNDKVQVPLAVVVSRASEADLVPSTMAQVGDSSGDLEIEEFLRDYGMDSLMNNLKLRFSNVRFFAFDSESDAGVSSAAVPFYWIMAQNNSRIVKWLE